MDSDDHGLRPSPGAAPASVFLDGHPVFLPSSSSTYLDDQAAGGSFHLPSSPFSDDTAPQDPLAPPSPGLASPPSAAAAGRKAPRKRPRASRRPPTTVLTTDTSNFRAMVQEFTGFPAPPPFAVTAPHLLPGGTLFSDSAAALPSFPLLRPSSHLSWLPSSRASLPPPSCTTSNTTSNSLVLDALAAFARSSNAIAPPAAAAAATPSSGSEFYGSWPFDDGFPAADGTY